MSDLHLFAGGNTSQGFYSCFEDILPAGERRRMFYIKGGPGVGKSTMMRRVAKAAAEAGQRVEYFHCSSDPDSLDGIALPDLGWAMMDGTAPHVYDPVTPGARDTLVSLGDYLDEAAMRPKAKEISALQEEISQRFRRCYRFLSAAGQLAKLLFRPTGALNPEIVGKPATLLAEKAGFSVICTSAETGEGVERYNTERQLYDNQPAGRRAA